MLLPLVVNSYGVAVNFNFVQVRQETNDLSDIHQDRFLVDCCPVRKEDIQDRIIQLSPQDSHKFKAISGIASLPIH